MMMTNQLAPMHPGEVLREEFLAPMGLTPYAVAKALNVPRTRIERLVREETPVTADTALRLSRYFGTSAEFWMNLQTIHDLRVVEREIGSSLDEIPRVAAREHEEIKPAGPAGRRPVTAPAGPTAVDEASTP